MWKRLNQPLGKKQSPEELSDKKTGKHSEEKSGKPEERSGKKSEPRSEQKADKLSEQLPKQQSKKGGSIFGLRFSKRSDRPSAKQPEGSKPKGESVQREKFEYKQVPATFVQQGPSEAVRSLLRTAIADAEQIAASIKRRAQTEVEAEAARIIAQAKIEVEEIRGKAEIAAQRDAEAIILEASKKADIIEVEAKQKAMQFLIKASEEIGKEIHGEYQSAYSRLFSSLQILRDEAQSIETEFSDKAARLLESKSLELEGYEAALLGTAEVAIPFMETRMEVEVDREVEAPVQLQEEAIEDKVEEPVGLEEIVGEKAEEAVQLQEEAIEEKVEELDQLREEAVEENVAEAVQLHDESIEEKVEEAVELKEETALPQAVAEVIEELPGQRPPEESGEVVVPVPPLVEMDKKALYSGEVELVIASPVELKLVSRFYNYLQKIPELRVLYTRGSWDQGTVITLVLEKSMPLLSLILETPGVIVTPQPLEKDGSTLGVPSSLLRGGDQKFGRIKLLLKEA